MSTQNEQTLQVYESIAEQYCRSIPLTVEGVNRLWIDKTLGALPNTASVLELGSCSGRDANYIESKGFVVQRTDAVEHFIEKLRQQGHTVRQLNVIRDAIPLKYDLVFANAVLLHLKAGEFKTVCKKIFKSLASGGQFAFSLQEGDGDSWVANRSKKPRYFCYWRPDDLESVLFSIGFSTVETYAVVDDGRKWIKVNAYKK